METFGRYLTYAIAILGAFVASLWVASVIWAFHDIRARTLDIYVRMFATLLVALLGPFGVALYLVLRPRDTLDEAYERALGEEALLREIDAAEYCPNCRHRVKGEYLLCPNCHTELRTTCNNCRRLLEFHWELCPYCGERQATAESAGR